jgi:hypothetical protein
MARGYNPNLKPRMNISNGPLGCQEQTLPMQNLLMTGDVFPGKHSQEFEKMTIPRCRPMIAGATMSIGAGTTTPMGRADNI